MQLPFIGKKESSARENPVTQYNIDLSGPEKLKPHESDEIWNLEAERLAKLCAKLHIENCNPEMVAKALADLPAEKALQFTYELGIKYRHRGEYDKAETVLAASQMIPRSTAQSGEDSAHPEQWHRYKENNPIRPKYRPADILAMPIGQELSSAA